MRSYVSYKKATNLFCLRPMFPFRAIAWNNKLYNGGGSGIGSAGNNKGRQHITFWWWITCSIQSYYHHHLSLSFARFLLESPSLVLSSARAHQFSKLNVDSCKRMSISTRSASFGGAAAFFCVESPPLYRPSFAQEKKRNTILHTVSHIIFHILIWTRMYLNIR